MSQSSILPNPAMPVEARESALAVGVALSSFAALLLELALTRLFSVVLFYHYAFLAISVTLLGLGAGGVFAYLRREWLLQWETRALAARISAICAVATFLVLEIILHTPVRLHLSGSSFRGLTILYVSAGIPFFLTGLLLSVVFARNPQRISRLYGADLAGGALACLATVPLLNTIGAPNAILLSGVVVAIAAMVWTTEKKFRLVGGVIAIVLLSLIAANHSYRLIDIIYAKGQRTDPDDVEFAHWNAISRVEVDIYEDGARYIVIDADANTAIPNQDPFHWDSEAARISLTAAAPALVNVLRPHGTYAIIGPGGGIDVLRAVSAGSPKVTGIEINPSIVNRIMKDRYAEYSHHLFQLPQVDIHVSDGRSFVRNSKESYDVLQMTLVDTWASTAAGAFALSENNLYTVQAFKEYFEHLKPDGMIAITRWEFQQPREALRVVSVAMDALHQMGTGNPAGNLMVISDGPLDKDGRPVLVLAKRSPFTPDEEKQVADRVKARGQLALLYMPSIDAVNPFTELIASNDPYGFARQYKFNVSPVTDDAPFFFFTLKVGQILRKSVAKGIDWKVNVGVVVLGLVLLLSLLAVLAFLIIPMVVRGGRRQRLLPLMYFIAVGLGFILVEITFIQRFVLFLGHPTYALTVVVFLLLLSSGAGSLLSRRLLKRSRQRLWPLGLIIVTLLCYRFLLPYFLPRLVGLSFSLKLLVSALLLVPLGFAMGMPFPSGLKDFASSSNVSSASQVASENAVEWAWAMNAASSVMGSVLAMVIALRYGLNVVLLCGAAAYLCAMIVNRTLYPRSA
jgi:hypothetical protein